MKKANYFIVALIAASFAVNAQPDSKTGDGKAGDPPNLMGLKLAFVTKQLSLSTDEAQKFWPVYYTYSAELKKTRQDQKGDVLAMEEGMLNVRKKYKTEFKKILTTDERVNKALTVDRDFSNVVRKELMQRAKMKGMKRIKDPV